MISRIALSGLTEQGVVKENPNKRRLYWLAIFWFPGLAACDFKGDLSAYLRKEPAEKQAAGSPRPPAATSATSGAPPKPGAATSASASPVASTALPTGSAARRTYQDAAPAAQAAPEKEAAAPPARSSAEAPPCHGAGRSGGVLLLALALRWQNPGERCA